MSNQIQLHECASYSYCACSWHQQTNPSEDFVFNQEIKFIYMHEFTCQFLTNLRQDHLRYGEMFFRNKIINALKCSWGNMYPFTTLTLLQHLTHWVKMLQNNWFICQLCVHRDKKLLGSLESTQEAREEAQELLRIFHVLQTFHMLHILMNARWCMNQLLKNTKGEE